MIWKLKHCLYGLKDGAGQFYLSVKEDLHKLGFEQCSVDPAIEKMEGCMESSALMLMIFSMLGMKSLRDRFAGF